MKINPNDTAVPTTRQDTSKGLTKLEWAAVKIMAAMVTTDAAGYGTLEEDCAVTAHDAVLYARALFAELEKQG